MTPTPELVRKAQRHLARRDAILKKLIRLVGPCTLQQNPDGFATLARSIIAQQISGKAAASISAKLEKATGRAGLTPRGVLKLLPEQLRACGLSTSKARGVRDLAEKVQSGEVPIKKLPEMADEEVIAALIPVFGIGRWTAEMYLMFSLGRLDVLPVADLGLRAAVKRHYELAELPGKKELTELGEPWRPYRSIATWYCWRSLGNVPQSEPEG